MSVCVCVAPGDEVDRQETDVVELHRQRGEREISDSVSVL